MNEKINILYDANKAYNKNVQLDLRERHEIHI